LEIWQVFIIWPVFLTYQEPGRGSGFLTTVPRAFWPFGSSERSQIYGTVHTLRISQMHQRLWVCSFLTSVWNVRHRYNLNIQSFGKLDLLRHQFEKHFKTGPFCFCWITRFMLFNDKFCSMRNERGRICKSKSVMMAELLIYSKNLKSVKSRTCFTLLNNKI